MINRNDELFHRRDVLRGSVAAVIGLLAPWSMEARAQPVPSRIRREVHDPQAAPMLELYKRAVRMMRALPPWDSKSWWFQANIHWLPFADDPQGCYEIGCFSSEEVLGSIRSSPFEEQEVGGLARASQRE
jgi:hypothetical protein